jgi:hypothetical protein
MSEDARLGVTTGYRNGWIHDASRVGSMWYSIIADDNNTSSTRGQLTVYLSYGYRPNEIPRSATISAEYPGMTIAKIVPPYTVAFFAIPTEREPVYRTLYSLELTSLQLQASLILSISCQTPLILTTAGSWPRTGFTNA